MVYGRLTVPLIQRCHHESLELHLGWGPFFLLSCYTASLSTYHDHPCCFLQTVTNVGGWVGKHCERGQSGGFGRTVSLGKRSVLDSSTGDKRRAVDCDTLKATVTGDDVPTEVLEALFDASDTNKDGVLSDVERVEYAAQLEETEKCLNSV
ncbi:uncharacterized protein [Littorina saxatilis]|uniref:uncharacterized protein n=1 Tax=Littorina saxatilis TaxID=31220 RepID=UPI0038B50C7D